MDIPRGHAMSPLSMEDFYDFIFNYFKAEYAPIRSFFSTATAEPRRPDRWVNMGHELAPLVFRPAHAQAQKDLATLDQFVEEKGIDGWFVKGIVIRFAKYDGHDRLERKLFEACRADLMVRKALKEKHLIDALWPSPPARNADQEFVQQGVKVRSWYGDMFAKYFHYLHAVDDFGLKEDVDERIKRNGQLNLIPFADHIEFGDVAPIVPIVAKGSGYNYSQRAATKRRSGNNDVGKGYGEPDRFEIRFDAPTSITDTLVKTVVRQTNCQKCNTPRDITIQISVDPVAGPLSPDLPGRPTSAPITKPPKPNTPTRRQPKSNASRRYSPGYTFPDRGNPQDPVVSPVSPRASRNAVETPPTSPPQKLKQCPRCTFLNHQDLTQCEMCSGDLPDSTLISPPPSPESTREPELAKELPAPEPKSPAARRPPPLPNRNRLSSTLFSIFPFSQQEAAAQEDEQKTDSQAAPELPTREAPPKDPSKRNSKQSKRVQFSDENPRPSSSSATTSAPAATAANESEPDSPWAVPTSQTHSPPSTPPALIGLTPSLDQRPEMSLMPLTSPEPHQSQHLHLEGLPQNLMDEYVPVSPGLRHEEEEDAGWGEGRDDREEESEGEDDDGEGRIGRGFVELDVGREERGIWGE